MTTFRFSRVRGTSVAFRPNNDVLNFDIGSAANLSVTAAGGNLILRLGNDSVTLLNVSQIGSLSTRNVSFADGSVLLIGDNTTGTANDSAANDLRGGAGNDQLIGLGGNDYLDGRGGSDTYGNVNCYVSGGKGR
jgi:prepilin-type processing-associated H-X9-DG protein